VDDLDNAYAMADEGGPKGKGLLALDVLVSSLTPTTANRGPAEVGWGRPETLERHFNDHGADFDASDPLDYALKARNFYDNFGKVPTKVDDQGVIRMYDPSTNTFAAYNADGTTRTFYKPDPAVHGFPSNWDYWLSQRGKAP
jgi:pyocin large subunit-like protein